jgi:hypothetical protein
MSRAHVDLLLWCARQATTGNAGAAPLAAMGREDWSAFLRATLDHSSLPIAWRALEPMNGLLPAEIAADMQTAFDANAIRNLRLAGDLVTVVRGLERHGVEAVTWKGAILAERAYGDLRMRQFFDIDLLVRNRDLAEARAALEEQGFHVLLPVTQEQLDAYVSHMGELEMVRESDGLWVELHTAIVPSYFSVGRSSESLWSRNVSWRVARAPLTALDPVDEMEALAIHGSKHRFERLAWIIDIAMMARLLDEADWRRLLRGARDHGTLRMVRLSLLLAESVCGLSIPASIAADVRGDRVAARLARMAHGSLFDPRPGRMDELLFHARMRERSRDQLLYLYNVIYTPSANDWSGMSLPGPLAWLYSLSRPLRLWSKFGLRMLNGAVARGGEVPRD